MKKWSKLIIPIFVVMFGGFLVLLFSGDQGILTLYHSHRQLQSLKKELKHSRVAIDSLTREVDRLKNDTTCIERIAREKFGMVRKNEKMYKFIEEK